MKLMRKMIVLLVLSALMLSTACSETSNNPKPTDKPTIEPEVPTPAPLSDEEAYDVSFSLPVTEQHNTVEPWSYYAVDGLGRTLSSNGDSYSSTLYKGKVGNNNDKKFVGIFYSDWHEELSRSTGINDVSKILEGLSEDEREEAKHDYTNAVWKKKTGYHFWGEPIYGYYSTADQYVLRKQAELLADAGVDCIIFDNTNGTFLWEKSFTAIFETFTQAKLEGVNVPQIVFMLPFGPTADAKTQLNELYEKIYSKGKWEDLWFMWEGKPLIMAHPECLSNSGTDKVIKNFFTFRRNDGSYFMDDGDDSHWGWLSTYPQAVYKNKDGSVEQITVGVAQNADYKRNCLSAMSGYNIMGRSYTKGDYSYNYSKNGVTVTVDSSIEDSRFYGLNFQQQWDYAMKMDPEFIFVTGWNEWIAMRMKEWAGDTSLNGKNIMVDQFDPEYSRDCEPSAGEMKDYYYYQLAENIRRFKGVDKTESKAAKVSIDIGGKISQWNDIPAYNTYVNSTWVRSKKNGSKGYASKIYTNESFRNDVVTVKVAYDDRFIYFYADCANEITSYTDEGWMRLFISTTDVDGQNADWEGFEYVINRVNPTDSTHCTLEKSTGGWNWETVGTIEYTVRKNVIQIRVPREMLGMELVGTPDTFCFKWCDNNLIGENEGNILDLYVNGEAAPGGRFCFVG